MGYGDLFLLWRDYGPFNEDVVRIYAAEIGYALGLLVLFSLFPRLSDRFRFHPRKRCHISRLENGKYCIR